jgi:hypothetical protein
MTSGRIVSVDDDIPEKKTFTGPYESGLLEQLEYEQLVGWSGVSEPMDNKGEILKEIILLLSTAVEEENQKRIQEEKIRLDKRWNRNG